MTLETVLLGAGTHAEITLDSFDDVGRLAGMSQPRLRVLPCDFKDAVAFVSQHHRHHKPPVGHKFSLCVADEQDNVRAVVMVGRPVARGNDDGMTLEVTRLASDGCPNACSCLYGAAWRAAKALGYGRLITYILDTEPGTSLKATGWQCLGQRGGGSWNVPSRPRVDKHPLQKKLLWEVR